MGGPVSAAPPTDAELAEWAAVLAGITPSEAEAIELRSAMLRLIAEVRRLREMTVVGAYGQVLDRMHRQASRIRALEAELIRALEAELSRAACIERQS